MTLAAITHLNTATLLDSFVSLAAAFGLGSLIGFERQVRQRTAGLRTNALVAVAAAAFVDMAAQIGTPSDTTRVIAYVVSGVGFLGAVLRLSTSAPTLASPGRCSTTSGEYTDSATSSAISRAMMPSARDSLGGLSLITSVNIATEPPRTTSRTRWPCHRPFHKRSATREHRDSHVCWPAEEPRS